MAVSYKDYYKVLGVARNAASEDIAKAYKKLARKHHPDLNPDNASAEEQFKNINEAHEVLKDPEKRKLYDQLGPDWQHGQQFQGGGFNNMHFNFNGQQFDGAGFSDFFETLFGQAQTGQRGRGGRAQRGARGGFGPDPFGNFSHGQQRGRDVEAEIFLSLEDAQHGGQRTITLQGPQGERTLSVTIPPGTTAGSRLRLSGQGESGMGGVAGDVLLRIQYVPHPLFTVEGNSLNHELALSPWEAVLGTVVRVPTLDGQVELTVPAGTSSGRKFRLRGKGLGSGARRGDLMVRVAIKSPDKLNDAERQLWQSLAATSSFKARNS